MSDPYATQDPNYYYQHQGGGYYPPTGYPHHPPYGYPQQHPYYAPPPPHQYYGYPQPGAAPYPYPHHHQQQQPLVTGYSQVPSARQQPRIVVGGAEPRSQHQSSYENNAKADLLSSIQHTTNAPPTRDPFSNNKSNASRKPPRQQNRWGGGSESDGDEVVMTALAVSNAHLNNLKSFEQQHPSEIGESSTFFIPPRDTEKCFVIVRSAAKEGVPPKKKQVTLPAVSMQPAFITQGAPTPPNYVVAATIAELELERGDPMRSDFVPGGDVQFRLASRRPPRGILPPRSK